MVRNGQDVRWQRRRSRSRFSHPLPTRTKNRPGELSAVRTYVRYALSSRWPADDTRHSHERDPLVTRRRPTRNRRSHEAEARQKTRRQSPLSRTGQVRPQRLLRRERFHDTDTIREIAHGGSASRESTRRDRSAARARRTLLYTALELGQPRARATSAAGRSSTTNS